MSRIERKAARIAVAQHEAWRGEYRRQRLAAAHQQRHAAREQRYDPDPPTDVIPGLPTSLWEYRLRRAFGQVR
jgi:hypothetical protein